MGTGGAVALADAVKALIMMLCFLWNMTGILVTRLNTASLPTCSFATKEAHLWHDLERVVWPRKSQPLHGKERRDPDGTYVQMKCTSCAVASSLRCSSHVKCDPRDSVTGIHRELTCHRFLRCPIVSWDGWRGRREVDDWRGKFLNCFAHAVATVATRTLGDVISRN